MTAGAEAGATAARPRQSARRGLQRAGHSSQLADRPQLHSGQLTDWPKPRARRPPGSRSPVGRREFDRDGYLSLGRVARAAARDV